MSVAQQKLDRNLGRCCMFKKRIEERKIIRIFRLGSRGGAEDLGCARGCVAFFFNVTKTLAGNFRTLFSVFLFFYFFLLRTLSGRWGCKKKKKECKLI